MMQGQLPVTTAMAMPMQGQIPMVTATAMPMTDQMAVPMDPMPMTTAMPMAPMPMTMNSVPPAVVFKFPCSSSKQSELKAMTDGGVPPALAGRGMTARQWEECVAALNGVVEKQFFKNCPGLECCYFCVPGGPIQMCLCMINPCSCVLCFQPVEEAKKACKLKCTAILMQCGYKCRYEDCDFDDAIIFEPA